MAGVWEVNFSYMDGEGKKSSSGFYLGSALTEAEALAEAKALLELIDDCTDGKLVGVGLTRVVDLTGWGIKANANVDANRKEKLLWLWGAGVYKTSFTIPARDKDVVVDGSENVDVITGGAAGTLLKVAFLAATTTNLGDETVDTFISAKEVYG